MDDATAKEDVVEENSQENEVSETPEQVNLLLNLEEMIKNTIDTVETSQVELKKSVEQYSDSFENNPTYIENQKKAKEAATVLSVTRENIAKQPSVTQLAAKIKDMRMTIKESQAALSDYLLEYQRMTQANEIEGNDGELRIIINTAKVVKKSSKK
ncbi:MAG TPA: hypothetical protein VJC10_04210 [Patescibacteria group bacterium]|nr:hypothetical protein [Patescibacteria group bacterium]